MKRVPFETLRDEFYRVLAAVGFDGDRGGLCARLFAENQRDGVYSHGLNRFPGFVAGLESKQINFRAQPEKIEGFGALERWDGKMGSDSSMLTSVCNGQRNSLMSTVLGVLDFQIQITGCVVVPMPYKPQKPDMSGYAGRIRRDSCRRGVLRKRRSGTIRWRLLCREKRGTFCWIWR